MKAFLATLMLLLAPAFTAADDGERLQANLIGYEEVPSVSTPASGKFTANVLKGGSTIEYTLSYNDIQGIVQQAHIHFAQKSVNGSIVIWLCQTATTPAPPSVANLTPFCPDPHTGKVSGTITAANVIAAGTTSQMILAGELDEVLAAIRAGFAYANVHATPLNPGGEIRGQIKDNRGKDDDGEDDDHDR